MYVCCIRCEDANIENDVCVFFYVRVHRILQIMLRLIVYPLAAVGLKCVTFDKTVQPTTKASDTVCKKADPVCSVTLLIEYSLTMTLTKEKQLI